MKHSKYQKYKDSDIAWLGKIPNHWKVTKAKQIWQKESRPIRDEDEIITVFRDGEVTLRKNRREDGFTVSLKEIGYQGVRKNDLVIHQMDAFAGAIGVSDSDGKCTPVYSICTPRIPANPHFYNLLLREMSRSKYILSLAKGIRERSTDFRFNMFGELEVPLPPKQEQTSIANFLDYKTEKINRFITKKKQLIELLNEQKAAIINHAVTKGLNPNVPMKDSGIEWLGDIPEHWEVVKNKYLHKINMGQSPSSDDYNFEGFGYPFLQGNAEFGELNPTPKTWCTEANKVCQENDILLSVRAPIGAVNIANQQLGIGRGLSSITCASNLTYWFYHFLILKDNLNSIGTGSTYFAISINDVKNIKLLNPPNEEKAEISEFIVKETSNIDKIISTIQKEITLVEEYKTALIAEAVTGKIDVRDFKIPTAETPLAMVVEEASNYNNQTN